MGDTTNAIKAVTKFTDDNIPRLTDEICELISIGYGLGQALRQKAEFPSQAVFYKWLADRDYVQEKYARARELQQDYEADNMIEIADTASDPNKARIQIDARKWRASKLAPKKYGDRLDLNHTGIPAPKSESDIDARLLALFAKAGIAGVDGAAGLDKSKDEA